MGGGVHCVNPCFDGILDANETDVDCGGNECYPCKPTQKCKVDTDCFTDLCDNTTYTCGGSGFFQTGGANAQHCVCNPGYAGSNCGVVPLVPTPPTSIFIATGLSAVAIVGIVVALALCFGVAGGGSYAMYNKMNLDKEAPLMSNPLYKGTGTQGHNPIFRNY